MPGNRQRFIHLYIRPTHGPISFMELDVDLVEQAALEWGGTQRDPARVQEIMRQITQKFPGVQVASYQNSIAMLVAWLSSAKNFAAFGLGFVLEAPGNIQQQNTSPAKNVQKEQIQALEKTIVKQESEMKQVMARYAEAEQRVVLLEGEIKRLRVQQNAEGQREVQATQQQLYQANQRVAQMQRQLVTLQREIEIYGRENGDLKVQYEALEMKYTHLNEESTSLKAQFEGLADKERAAREARDEAVSAKAQLEQTLQAREEEIEQLQARLHMLIEGEVTETVSSSESIMLG